MSSELVNDGSVELCGFIVNDQRYAISVQDVQEVVRKQKTTRIPKAPPYINGLINLRGQIVTTLNLRKLFKMDYDEDAAHMNIIIKKGDSMYSLIVDKILDVTNVDSRLFEDTPRTMDDTVAKYIKGVYKLDEALLLHVDIDEILGD